MGVEVMPQIGGKRSADILRTQSCLQATPVGQDAQCH